MSGVDPTALEQFLVPERISRLDQVLSHRSESLTVVLDEVHHPHNISAVMRSADAFGIRDLHIIGGRGLEFSRTIALGSEQWVKIFYHRNQKEAVQALTEGGYKIVVTAPESQYGADNPSEESSSEENPSVKNPSEKNPCMPIWQLPFEQRLALVFGNEKRGISAELNSAAVYRTFIPMYGFVESLNISVACAISLFASTLSGARGERRLAPLDIESRAELRSEWIKKSTKRADVILKEMSRRGESPSEDITSLGNISLDELGEDLLASGRKSGDKLRGSTEGD